MVTGLQASTDGLYFALPEVVEILASPAKSNVVRFGIYDFEPPAKESRRGGLRRRHCRLGLASLEKTSTNTCWSSDSFPGCASLAKLERRSVAGIFRRWYDRGAYRAAI